MDQNFLKSIQSVHNDLLLSRARLNSHVRIYEPDDIVKSQLGVVDNDLAEVTYKLGEVLQFMRKMGIA